MCPYFAAGVEYVAFNGNGHRRGMGYLIVGRTGTGWLAKCGYAVPGGRKDLRREIRRFLADLGVVAGILGLTVLGFRSQGVQWLDLAKLQGIARRRDSIARLEGITLRIYGPPDYADRLRRHLEERGRLHIPDPNDPSEFDLASATDDQIRDLIYQRGLTGAMLARELDCKQQFISDLLRGRKSWPADKRTRVIDYPSRGM